MLAGPGPGNLVVVHFQDGRVLKGTTQDFAPTKLSFHLFVDGEATAKPLDVMVGALKAVFFVKSFDGDPKREDDYDFDRANGQGRRVVVTFRDGETVAGHTMGYARDKPAFFLVPADPGSNNSRIFVVVGATKKIEFLPASRSASATGR